MESPIDLSVIGPRGQSAIGLFAFAGIAWLFSSDRRQDVIDLAPRALISGTLATLMTGAVIGLI